MSKRILTPVHGLTPVRVRRRQSDAKWRASVASCYDTLKLVIPNANKLSKKKVSKALILQETERHINHLEFTLSQLFNLKAPELGKTVLWKEGETYHPASLNDIKSDFEEKQSEIFSQSSHGRRRYHLLSDIEGQLVDMTVNFENLSIVTRIGNMVLHGNRANTCTQKGISSTGVNNINRNRTYYSHGLLDGHIIPLTGDTNKVEMLMVQNIDNEDDVHTVPVQLTPEKSHPALNNSSDPSMAALSDPYLNSPLYISETDVLLASPKLAKVTKQLNFSSSFESSTDFLEESATPMKTTSFSLGFTPVKLPSEPEEEEDEKVIEEDHSQPGIKEEDNLICLETFDTDDSCDVQTEKTPDNRVSILESSLFHDSPKKLSCKRKLNLDRELPRHKREEGYIPKCRRRLESMFTNEPGSSKSNNNNLPIINGVFDKDADCSDFDGYFLFYHQMASQLEGYMSRSEIASPSVASMVSGLWNTMPKEDRDTLATLAQLQTPVETASSQSSLSDDLQELVVKPFNNYKSKEEEENKRLLEDCGLHIVPDDMDLGVSLLPDSDFYTFTRNTKSKETNDLIQEQGFELIDDFQVVPEL